MILGAAGENVNITICRGRWTLSLDRLPTQNRVIRSEAATSAASQGAVEGPLPGAPDFAVRERPRKKAAIFSAQLTAAYSPHPSPEWLRINPTDARIVARNGLSPLGCDSGSRTARTSKSPRHHIRCTPQRLRVR
jgi:hypothetical protein